MLWRGCLHSPGSWSIKNAPYRAVGRSFTNSGQKLPTFKPLFVKLVVISAFVPGSDPRIRARFWPKILPVALGAKSFAEPRSPPRPGPADESLDQGRNFCHQREEILWILWVGDQIDVGLELGTGHIIAEVTQSREIVDGETDGVEQGNLLIG